MQWIRNELPKTEDKYLSTLCDGETQKVINFHRSFPNYEVTPLAKLSNLAASLNLKNIYAKDESYRFGLNAFKVLGGSYAIANYIAKQTNKDISEVSYNFLTSDALKKEFNQATFFTATDGNHGRGVAWAANKLGQKCVVRMPKGSTETRRLNIEKEHATVTIEDVNYDECVRIAAKEAEACENGVLVQDTAWDGYEEIPTWIMQGYTTLVNEANNQLHQDGCKRPTHVFVQAGVGCLAGGVVGYFANQYKENPPIMVVAEAKAADCLYQSAVKQTGERVNVTGDMFTIMAGLACGEANTISWDILKNHATVFCSCPDEFSANGTRIYYSPLKDDPRVISGESGSVTLGLLYAIMTNPKYATLKSELQLDENSEVLLISTEGDTDPDRFREIIWDGLCGTQKDPFEEDR